MASAAAAYFVLFRQGKILPKTGAEVIAFAVLPEYRRKNSNGTQTDFYKKYRVNVGKELLASAIGQLDKMKIRELKIQADASNEAANKFYRKYGCKVAEARFSFMGSKLNVYAGNIRQMLKKLSSK